MRTNITVISVGKTEKLSGGAPKLIFSASNGDGVESEFVTYKPAVIEEVKAGAILDVDIDEIGEDRYKVTWLYKTEDTRANGQAQSGTWREEKAAEIIANLVIADKVKTTSKLYARLLTWLNDSMPED